MGVTCCGEYVDDDKRGGPFVSACKLCRRSPRGLGLSDPELHPAQGSNEKDMGLPSGATRPFSQPTAGSAIVAFHGGRGLAGRLGRGLLRAQGRDRARRLGEGVRPARTYVVGQFEKSASFGAGMLLH